MLWYARDGGGVTFYPHTLFSRKPVWSKTEGCFDTKEGDYLEISDEWVRRFPKLKPGECVKVRLERVK